MSRLQAPVRGPRLIPVHGNDVWLHALLAAVAAYFGFVRHAEDEVRVAV